MAFDTAAFGRADWRPRQKTIPAPAALVPFFGDDPAEFVVRGLTGPELARMREEGDRVELMTELGNKFAGGGADEIAEAVTARYGFDPEATPATMYKNVYAVEHGLVSPSLSRRDVLAINQHHPGLFLQLANVVTQLSAEGSEPGKPVDSGGTGGSEST